MKVAAGNMDLISEHLDKQQAMKFSQLICKRY